MKIKEQNLPEEKTTSKTRIRIENHHPDHPSLSSKTKVAYSPDKGRYVVAAEAIAPGELIGVDVPNVSFTHFDLVSDTSKACHNCVEKFHSEPFVTKNNEAFITNFSCLNYGFFFYADYLSQSIYRRNCIL